MLDQVEVLLNKLISYGISIKDNTGPIDELNK